jgi:hypothetical protein
MQIFENNLFRKQMKLDNKFKDFTKPNYLFYPGSGLDASAIVNLTQTMDLDFIIYADYITEIDQLEELKFKLRNNFFTCGDEIDVKPNFLNNKIKSWAEYWHPESIGQYSSSESAWAKLIPLKTPQEKTIHLLYMRTEAIRTYKLLNRYLGAAHVVVVQDHGLGCFWTDFGGYSKMYLSAKGSLKLPEFLYLDEFTNPWPKYIQHAPYENCYDMVGNIAKKALFKKITKL